MRAPLLALVALAACAAPAPRPSTTHAGLRALLGNLHSQTNDSDGGHEVEGCERNERPQRGRLGPREAYAMARERAGLDFLLVSDHNHMFDGSTGTRADATAAEVLGRFARGRAIAREERERHPDFLAIYGLEFGVIANGGHVNLIEPDGLVGWERNDAGELLAEHEVDRRDFRALYRLMKARGWLGQFNHPSADQFSIDGAPLAPDPAGFDVMALAEIVNSDAFSTRMDGAEEPGGGYEGAYQRLLLAGYRLAPTSNQDNHCANWGLSGPNRTGVWVASDRPVDLEGFLSALRARRVFATTDRRSTLLLRANGAPMGAELGEVARLELELEHEGDELRERRLFVGEIGATRVESRTIPARAVLEVPRGPRFWYVRLTELDGTRLWSAPVWTR